MQARLIQKSLENANSRARRRFLGSGDRVEVLEIPLSRPGRRKRAKMVVCGHRYTSTGRDHRTLGKRAVHCRAGNFMENVRGREYR